MIILPKGQYKIENKTVAPLIWNNKSWNINTHEKLVNLLRLKQNVNISPHTNTHPCTKSKCILKLLAFMVAILFKPLHQGFACFSGKNISIYS